MRALVRVLLCYGALEIVSVIIIIIIIQPLRRIWPAKKSKSAKKRKIRAITPFKVTVGHRGRYQSKARMRLPISD